MTGDFLALALPGVQQLSPDAPGIQVGQLVSHENPCIARNRVLARD